MNLQTEILINNRIRGEATNLRNTHTGNESGTSEKKKTLIPFPTLTLYARLTNEQILKEKGTISVQNMTKAVTVARA